MTEEPKSFSVKDRRLFTADGDVRRSEGEEQSDSAAIPTPAAPEPAVDARPEVVAEPSAPESTAEPESVTGAEIPADLIGLLVSFASQGLQALSTTPPHLREARAMVALLEMLRDKTEGRRTPEEQQALESLLYQLRMAYLERSRVGGA